VKLRDLERHLTAQRARMVGEGGRHTKWRSEDGTRVTAVPRHREIGPGLVRAICSQLRIPTPDSPK
jgi:predicted RNA binding protein YcfA (HicA-like mRNA interferase family)